MLCPRAQIRHGMGCTFFPGHQLNFSSFSYVCILAQPDIRLPKGAAGLPIDKTISAGGEELAEHSIGDGCYG